jgi:hypothetical protein
MRPSHQEAVFRDALSRAEAEGQLAHHRKKNAALELEKATASPRIFEEGDIPMKKATNEQLVTVIYYLGSIDCIFRAFSATSSR